MANRGLGTLTLSLAVSLGAFTGPLDKAGRDLEKKFRHWAKLGDQFGNALGKGLGLAAIAATTALIGITKAAIDNADAIRDLSIRTGIGTETLSAYGYAASQTGTSIESLAKGLNILAKNAAAAINPTSAQAKIFEALGITVTDAEGKLKDLDVLVPEVADKFKGLEDGTTKTALALKLLGRSGVELTEFFNLGSDGIAKFIDKVRELGVEVDENTAAAADEFKDTLGEVKVLMGGLGLTIARELLPSLKEGAADFRDLVKEGDLAHNMVTVLSAAFSFGVGAINAYNDAVKTTSAVMDFMTQAGLGWQESVRNIWAPWSDGTVAGGIAKMKQAMADGDLALQQIQNPRANQFSNVRGGANTVGPSGNVDERALGRALSNPSAAKKGSGGKSDAEKEAEALEKALRRMADAERDWQVELNDNGNPIAKEYAGRLADITAQAEKFKEDGIPTKEVTEFVERMKALAGSIQSKEIVEFQKEFTDQTLELAAAAQGPGASGFLAFRLEIEELDKQLANSQITLEQYTDRVDSMSTPFEEVNASLLEEIKLLGMSAKAQEVYNNLKHAGVEASSALGAEIVANTERMQEARRVADLWAEAENYLADTIFDLTQDIGNAGDIIKDFFDNIAKSITRSISEDWAGTITDWFKGLGTSGSTGSQGGGFDWGALFGSFFGGGKAGGGAVSPGMFYRINENGPETLSVGGSDYLMMGSQGGTVTPNSGRAGAGIVQNIQFNVRGQVNNDTRQQVSQRMGLESNKAISRNR